MPFTAPLPNGYTVLPAASPPQAITDALRRTYLEFRAATLTPDIIYEWDRTTWFPNIRPDPVFSPSALLGDDLVTTLGEGIWCEPQILVRLPDWHDASPVWHVDETPPWAPSRSAYRYIVQVNLTDALSGHGCVVTRGPDADPVPVPTRQGDVVVMHPDLPHSGSPNLGPTPRVAVYLRLLSSP